MNYDFLLRFHPLSVKEEMLLSIYSVIVNCSDVIGIFCL